MQKVGQWQQFVATRVCKLCIRVHLKESGVEIETAKPQVEQHLGKLRPFGVVFGHFPTRTHFTSPNVISQNVKDRILASLAGFIA